MWAVEAELARKLCGPDAPTCDELQQGGLRVTTTLDYGLQQIAEKWVKAAVIAPHAGNPQKYVTDTLKFDEYPAWIRNLRNKDVRNGAWWPSTTRPARSSPTSGRPTTTGRRRTRSSSRSTTS